MSSLTYPLTGVETLQNGGARDYAVYGLRVRSVVRLTLPEILAGAPADVEITDGESSQFADASMQVELDPTDWIHYHELTGGWIYLRYDDLFEFLVSPNGDQILYRLLGPVSLETFQTYALGRVFSFALVKMGHEPLHAATVVVDGRAVAFLGASTFGKSSLAACFVAAGHRLLTDDVLRVEVRGGGCVAFPGPARLKLLPGAARQLFGPGVVGTIMNPREADVEAPKLVFTLTDAQTWSASAPLAVIYALARPRKGEHATHVAIDAASPRDAVVKLLANTHNDILDGRARLSRQFEAAQKVATAVPVRRLSYPRLLTLLPEVRDAVLNDLRRSTECDQNSAPRFPFLQTS